MKNHQLLSLTFVCFLLVMASCKMKPQPPEAMKLPTNENSERDYSKAENEYASKWMERFGSLKKTIQAELLGRKYNLPPEETAGNDTAVTAAEPWSLFVKDGKEVHAVSKGKGKTENIIIFTENDPAFTVRLRTSSSKNFIFIESTSAGSSEVSMLPFSCKSHKPMLIQERKLGVFYKVKHFGGNNLWILSNDNAPMRCLFIAPVLAPGPAHWKAAVRENDSVFIDDYSLIDHRYLILVQRRNLRTSIQITSIYPEDDKEASVENVINFPEPEGRISDLSFNQADSKIVFRYASILTPLTCYTYGIHSMHMGIRWKKQIKNYVPDDYKAEVFSAAGKNNVRIPVSMIRKKDLDRMDGTNPLLLVIETGKPGEQNNDFSPEMLSLTDRGFFIAVVHISPAASSERECIDKVTAVVSAMIDKKYTSAGLVTISGKGDGAMLAFNIANEHPAWVKALILESPDFSCNTKNSTAPYIYLNTFTARPDKASAGLALASALRKITKPENTLLVSNDNDSSPDQNYKAGLITFILSANGIDK
jgi:protease II